MTNNNPIQTSATPFLSRLSVSLDFSLFEAELNLYIRAVLNQDPKLLEVAAQFLTKAIAEKGALFLAVEHAMSPDFGASNE